MVRLLLLVYLICLALYSCHESEDPLPKKVIKVLDVLTLQPIQNVQVKLEVYGDQVSLFGCSHYTTIETLQTNAKGIIEIPPGVHYTKASYTHNFYLDCGAEAPATHKPGTEIFEVYLSPTVSLNINIKGNINNDTTDYVYIIARSGDDCVFLYGKRWIGFGNITFSTLRKFQIHEDLVDRVKVIAESNLEITIEYVEINRLTENGESVEVEVITHKKELPPKYITQDLNEAVSIEL